MKQAEDYFFKKATLEVKNFVKRSKYENVSQEIDGILYYSGRILPTDKIDIIVPMTAVMQDLHATTFCVPVLDKHSPLSYSIVMDIHWHNKTVQHAGIESVWRYILKKVFIIEGRDLVKKIKQSCVRCCYIKKKTVSVSMGKILDHNIIAPAFYLCQIDLAGPFKSYSNHYRRQIKVWMIIFCCTTTSATSIKMMDDYSSNAFMQAFTRFSCQFGYPKRLLVDSGSQLIKAGLEIRP